MEEIIVRRNELYDQVWKEPMSSLARRYNISDVGLAKVCRKLNVPIPPRGYWAKVQSGQKRSNQNYQNSPKAHHRRQRSPRWYHHYEICRRQCGFSVLSKRIPPIASS